MTRDDVVRLFALVQARYPRTSLIPSLDDQRRATELAIRMWTDVLDDVPAEDVFAVFQQWSKTEKWAPDPSELRERAMNRDGRRPARLADLRRTKAAGTLVDPDKQAELAELEAGQPLRASTAALLDARGYRRTPHETPVYVIANSHSAENGAES